MALPPRFLKADELGIRLEIVRGLPIWEEQPGLRHQKAIDRIRESIRGREGAACRCVHVSDIYVQFPDGSLKRPDVSIFCREPDEQEEAVTLVPEAVVATGRGVSCRHSRWSWRSGLRSICRKG